MGKDVSPLDSANDRPQGDARMRRSHKVLQDGGVCIQDNKHCRDEQHPYPIPRDVRSVRHERVGLEDRNAPLGCERLDDREDRADPDACQSAREHPYVSHDRVDLNVYRYRVYVDVLRVDRTVDDASRQDNSGDGHRRNSIRVCYPLLFPENGFYSSRILRRDVLHPQPRFHHF